MERWTDRRILQSWSRMQSNAAELIQSPLFPLSMEIDRRIDRLSVCVGALLSAHSSITSASPGSSVYWWLEMDERYEAEESVCYTNQFLTGEWTWRILAGRRMECVCLLPWGPEFTMWVLLFKEHRQLRLLQNCTNVTKSAQHLGVCTCEDKCLCDWSGQVWERSISAAAVDTCCFLSDKQHVLFSSISISIFLVPSQSLHLPFPLSFALSLSFPPPTHLLALLQCALIGWKLVSNHFNFVRVGYTIGYLEQAWARERGRAGDIPLGTVPAAGRAQWAWLRKRGPGRLAACLDRTGWSRTCLFGLEAFRD